MRGKTMGAAEATAFGYNPLLAQILGLEGIVRVQNPTLMKTEGRSAKWYIRAWVDVVRDGKVIREQQRIYLGSCDTMNKREALKEKTRVLDTINRSQYVAQAQIPFGEFLDLYERNHVPTLKTSTQAKYTCHIKNHIRPAFGPKRMAEITTFAIEQWLTGKRATLSGATLMDLRNIMCSVFTKADDWGHWKDRNPTEHVRVKNTGAVREQRKLTEIDTLRLLAELPPTVRLIVEAALFCTLRISEVMGLQWKHVDFATGMLYVRQRYWRGNVDTPKTKGSSRDVPMGLLAEELKLRWPGITAGDMFVFSVPTHRGETRDDRVIMRTWLRPVAKKLGLYYKGFGYHAFRREAITLLAREMDPMSVARMAGHSRLDQTLAYVLADQDKQRQGVEAIQKRMGKERIN